MKQEKQTVEYFRTFTLGIVASVKRYFPTLPRATLFYFTSNIESADHQLQLERS
jgi:hypothetical protein